MICLEYISSGKFMKLVNNNYSPGRFTFSSIYSIYLILFIHMHQYIISILYILRMSLYLYIKNAFSVSKVKSSYDQAQNYFYISRCLIIKPTALDICVSVITHPCWWYSFKSKAKLKLTCPIVLRAFWNAHTEVIFQIKTLATKKELKSSFICWWGTNRRRVVWCAFQVL